MTDDTINDGWAVPPDGFCLVCALPFRYETSDARDYQRYCSGDCERADEQTLCEEEPS